jgi:hypothetical protein
MLEKADLDGTAVGKGLFGKGDGVLLLTLKESRVGQRRKLQGSPVLESGREVFCCSLLENPRSFRVPAIVNGKSARPDFATEALIFSSFW